MRQSGKQVGKVCELKWITWQSWGGEPKIKIVKIGGERQKKKPKKRASPRIVT